MMKIRSDLRPNESKTSEILWAVVPSRLFFQLLVYFRFDETNDFFQKCFLIPHPPSKKKILNPKERILKLFSLRKAKIPWIRNNSEMKVIINKEDLSISIQPYNHVSD